MHFEFGAYTLDGARFELRREGVVIPVQRRVLDTILCLIENRGRVVTKDDLVAGPWEGAAVTDAALNRAVMLARRAVQQERGDPPCIQTVRGRGFLWTAPVREKKPSGPAVTAKPQSAASVRSAASAPEGALTDREVRVRCVLLVGPSPTRSSEIVDSLLSMIPPPPEPAWGPDGKSRASDASKRARVDHLADDSVLITLPAGLTLTDQVTASARYASSLRGLLPDAPMVLCTGPVATSGSVSSGEVVDRAAKLLPGAAPGAIRVDATTAELLTAQFLIAEEGDDRYLTGPRTLEDVPRKLLGKDVPCLGRDRELKLLEDIFAGVVDQREARAVLLTAPAGGGKTRVRQELVRRLQARHDNVRILLGRGDSLRADSPFGLVGALVRSAAGVFGGDSLENRRQKVRALVAHRVASEKVPRVAAFLGEISGIPFADGESAAMRAARQDAWLMGEQMRTAWLDWIEAECAADPILLAIEDLHWSDLPSVQLVDATLRTLRETRLMVLAVGRPEVTTRFSHLWEARGLEMFALSPLPRKICESIAMEVLGNDVARGVVAKVIAQADGNPFFLEELVRGVAVGRTELPETVVGTVQARLDALGSDAARVLRAASVFGDAFNSRAIRLLLGLVNTRELDATLDSLADREVIVPRHAGGTNEYVFRHSIMRDASYATLTGADRVLGHRLAGEWLEGRDEADAAVLAEHFDLGADRARAAVWFARAAGQSLRGGDLDAAIARAERSVASGAAEDTLSEASLYEAQARYWRGELAAAVTSAQRAIENASEGTTQWFDAIRGFIGTIGEQDGLGEIARWAEKARASVPRSRAAAEAQVACLAWCAGALAQSGRLPLATSLLERAETTFASLPTRDAWVTLRLRHANGIRFAQTGDFLRAIQELELGLDACEQAGDTQAACGVRGELAIAWVELGDYHRAELLLRRTIIDAQKRSLVTVETFTLPDLGNVLIGLGRLDEARETLGRSLGLAKNQGSSWGEALSHLFSSTLAFVSRDFVDSETHARSALEKLSTMIAPRAAALAALARALLAQGRTKEALESAQQAISLIEPLGSSKYEESLVRLMNAETKMAAGDEPGARDAIAAARDRLLDRAERINDAGMRESFLTRVADNVRTLKLADEWGVGQRRNETSTAAQS